MLQLTWKAVKYSDDSISSESVILFRVLYFVPRYIERFKNRPTMRFEWYNQGSTDQNQSVLGQGRTSLSDDPTRTTKNWEISDELGP